MGYHVHWHQESCGDSDMGYNNPHPIMMIEIMSVTAMAAELPERRIVGHNSKTANVSNSHMSVVMGFEIELLTEKM